MGAIVQRAIVRVLLSRGLLYGGGYCSEGYCTGAIVLELVIERGLWHFAGFDSASQGHFGHLPQALKSPKFLAKSAKHTAKCHDASPTYINQ